MLVYVCVSPTDERRAMMNLNNLPTQHVNADDLPLPELPMVISTTTSSGEKAAGYNELPLQYSIEEEDGGSSPTPSETIRPTATSSEGTEYSCHFDDTEC